MPVLCDYIKACGGSPPPCSIKKCLIKNFTNGYSSPKRWLFRFQSTAANAWNGGSSACSKSSVPDGLCYSTAYIAFFSEDVMINTDYLEGKRCLIEESNPYYLGQADMNHSDISLDRLVNVDLTNNCAKIVLVPIPAAEYLTTSQSGDKYPLFQTTCYKYSVRNSEGKCLKGGAEPAYWSLGWPGATNSTPTITFVNADPSDYKHFNFAGPDNTSCFTDDACQKATTDSDSLVEYPIQSGGPNGTIAGTTGS